jgi:hypothetical protein
VTVAPITATPAIPAATAVLASAPRTPETLMFSLLYVDSNRSL